MGKIMKQYEIDDKIVFDSLKDVKKNLEQHCHRLEKLIKCITNLTNGIDPTQDHDISSTGTKVYDIFYQNLVNCFINDKMIDVCYIFDYVLSTKENKNDLFKLTKETLGMITPVTNRKIKKLLLTEEETKGLSEKELAEHYVARLIEILDCYREIIVHEKMNMKNKNIVNNVAVCVTRNIYNLVVRDISKNKYCRICYNEINKIIKLYEKQTKELIIIEEKEKVKEELNENIILQEPKSILYGDLLIEFVDDYNAKVHFQNASKITDNVLKKLLKNGEDRALEALDKTSKLLVRKMGKKDDKAFYLFINYLLDIECEKAYNGNSYSYYQAINGLSADYSRALYDKEIHPYTDDEEYVTKLIETVKI